MVELVIPDIAPSANKFYAGMNPHARRRLAHQWHGMVLLAAKKQKMQRITNYPVDVEVYCNFAKGRRLLDADNLFPTIKLVLDGLIMARVLADDSPKYIGSVKLIPQKTGEKDSHTLVVIKSVEDDE